MIETSKPVFLIDSNILVYAYDNTDPQKHEVANKLLNRCWKKKETFALSVQNLAEFFAIITRKISQPISIEQAEIIINDIINFSQWRILHYDEHTFQKAILLYKSTQKHFWDALIAATMLQSGILHIYTENVTDFRKFENITVVNPLE